MCDDNIELILEYAEEHPSFDADFVHELADKQAEYGELTPNQEYALENIIEKFRIKQWKKKKVK